MEVDIAPKNRPELESLIEGSIGELSVFHQTFGFYVDGVEIDGIVLPKGWSDRLVRVSNPNTNGYCGLCLAPSDLAASKLAAARPKDLEFVAALLQEGIVSAAAVENAIHQTTLLDHDRRKDLLAILARLRPIP